MSEEKININRPLVGVLAVACLAAAAAIWIAAPDGTQSNMWRGGFVRVGVLLCALWFALPTRDRPAAWANVSPLTFVVGLMALAAVVTRPRVMLPIVIVLGIIGLVLRPRPTRQSRVHSDRRTR